MGHWMQDNPLVSGGLALMGVGTALAMLRRLPAQLGGLAMRRLTISVEIPDRDPAFRWLQAWLAQQRYARNARRLSLTTTWERPETDPDIDPDDDAPATGKASQARFLLTPAPGTHVMAYRGRLLVLCRARRDLQNGGAMSFSETLTLQFLGGDRGLVDALLAEAQRTALPRTPVINILTPSYQSWVATSWRPRRPLGSIILADGMLEELIADLREFLRSAAWYQARGVPHRRGYLLHGPPGNGKTTLVTAAAGELGLSVAVLSLNDRTLTDDKLRALVDNLTPCSVLLIEDVDCAFGPKRKSGDDTGVTLSGLLNALDGVSSREGRILFLTTNHPERLDPALVRPGRVDRSLRLANTSADQARRLFAWFYAAGRPDESVDRLARAFAARIPEGLVCMAAIQEHLLRHRHDPESAVESADLLAPDGAAAEVAPAEDAPRPRRRRRDRQPTA